MHPARHVRLVPLAFLTLLPGTILAQQSPAPGSTGVKLSGYLQARETWRENVGLTGSINRARLTAGGGVGSEFTWRVQGEFRTGNVGSGKASVALQDAYIRWKRKELGVQAGQFKTPFTREFTTSLPDLETADRSTVVDSLAPKRDIGVMGDYDFHRRATLSVGLFNGEGQNVTANSDSTLLGVARLAVRPIPEIVVGANLARFFGDSTRYGADVNYEGTRITVRGEYVAQSREVAGGTHDRGWLVLGAFKVSAPVQVAAKYEKFERPAIGSAQDNRAFTGAAHFYLAGSAVRLTLQYVNRKVGDPGVKTETILTQLQLRF